MGDVQLRVYSPIWASASSQFIVDVSPEDGMVKADKWLRSFSRGPFIGTFDLYGDEGWLANFFYSYLGYDFKETVGSIVNWDGFVFEMELTVGGSTRRRTYETLYNAVAVVWGDEGEITPWAENADSIARYGRREFIEQFSCPEAAALIRAQTILAQHAWPWPRPMGLNKQNVDTPMLRVRVCGYSFAANFLYANDVGVSTDNASDIVRSVVTSACPWFVASVVKENTIQVDEFRTVATRAWDWITEIGELGDSNYAPWIAWVDVGRVFRYEKMPIDAPRYYWQDGKLSYGQGGDEINPYLVRPGVVRDLSFARGRVEPGSIFQDFRDGWVDEVECGPAGVSLRSIGSEYDVLERQQQYAVSTGELDVDLRD